MDWIKANYDRLILIASALFAAAISILVILGNTGLADAFSDRNSPKPPDNTIPAPPVEPLAGALQLLASPPVWRAHEGSLLVSRPYIERDGSLIDPMAGDEKLHPPVPNAWLIRFNLDYADPNILSSDPDGDGFTVLEEWKAETDPTDPTSNPPFWTKLKLQEYIPDPIRIRFTSTPDGGRTFSLNLLSPDQQGRLRPFGPTQFLALGDTIEVSGASYELVSYEPKSVEDRGIEKDISELVIKDTKTGETITLIRDVVVDSPSSTGKIRNLLDNEVIEVKKGATFAITQDADTEYKLVDITEENALIQNLKSGEKHTLNRL
jgi:hypothetical protein